MSDAVRELEIEIHGFYVGAAVTLGDPPEQPNDVRPRPIIRRHTGEVVGFLNLTTRDAGLLSQQLDQGINGPKQAAALGATLRREREERQ